MKPTNNHINYIELKATNLEATKTFYSNAFGWQFKDYGDSYIAFESSGLDGGFEKSNQPIVNGALVVLYHNDLESIKSKLIQLGATISVDIFSFPGGKRFQFLDPSGNELAIWSE
ncbi:VOC family protein [Mesoflavibacter zeaxanthinifaciens]|uniref:VOC family protein n=1 Tax=Mesoflavibacter zeaxanthinifaciens TaxID=393060 RepID=UPI000409CF15|nr:VOC family protein [Mesoflavibacter zeaxanthinifaciens]